MTYARHRTCAAITYRANSSQGRNMELSLVMPAYRATVADAWTRLSAAYRDVDPRSIEIEIHHRAR